MKITRESLKATLLEKNAAYGNSALEPVRVFSKASATEQILVRLDDKISRLVRGHHAGEDVFLDLAGYCVLYLIAQHYSAVLSPKTIDLVFDNLPDYGAPSLGLLTRPGVIEPPERASLLLLALLRGDRKL